eukprot:CAMPEP_0182538106 /NCGR_PEP_ID=MMETSP1323-20130603/23178_1 /TAXON_ID=236787 /ORGANISM="Florenciella parvula, Strain RCC1693" /LENGTH=376 /DNA_ID=CAMNT_0024748555 /DNA_START=361 /DNA_END=1488 /DNA_ORIENTATION=+
MANDDDDSDSDAAWGVMLKVVSIMSWLIAMAVSLALFFHYENHWRMSRRNFHEKRKAGGLYRCAACAAVVLEGTIFIATLLFSGFKCGFTDWRLVLYQCLAVIVTFSWVLLTLKIRTQLLGFTLGMQFALTWRSSSWVRLSIPVMCPQIIALIAHFIIWTKKSELFFLWVCSCYAMAITGLLVYYTYHLMPFLRNRTRPEGVNPKALDWSTIKLQVTVVSAVLLCVAGVTCVILAPTLRTNLFQTMPSCYLQSIFCIGGLALALIVEMAILSNVSDAAAIYRKYKKMWYSNCLLASKGCVGPCARACAACAAASKDNDEAANNSASSGSKLVIRTLGSSLAAAFSGGGSGVRDGRKTSRAERAETVPEGGGETKAG